MFFPDLVAVCCHLLKEIVDFSLRLGHSLTDMFYMFSYRYIFKHCAILNRLLGEGETKLVGVVKVRG